MLTPRGTKSNGLSPSTLTYKNSLSPSASQRGSRKSRRSEKLATHCQLSSSALRTT